MNDPTIACPYVHAALCGIVDIDLDIGLDIELDDLEIDFNLQCGKRVTRGVTGMEGAARAVSGEVPAGGK